MREHVVPASTTPQYRAYTRTHQPLALHPQFEVITVPSASDGSLTSGATEYRVYNFRRWRTGRIVRGDGWGGLEVACITLLVVGPCTAQFKAVWIAIALVLLWTKARTVLYESVTPLPGLGIQLTTVRGVSLPRPSCRSPRPQRSSRILIPLFRSSVFIAHERISSILINEGLVRWKVAYYLAIVERNGTGITVVFDNVRPPMAVLREVLHKLRESEEGGVAT